jgi:hypothetical protein
MKRKPARGRTHRERITGAELEARREGQQLRRLRDQQRRVVALSRELLAAVKRADLARKALVVDVCDGTNYTVMDRVQLGEHRAGAGKLRDQLLDAAIELVNANRRIEDLNLPFKRTLDYITRVDAVLSGMVVEPTGGAAPREQAAAGSSCG